MRDLIRFTQQTGKNSYGWVPIDDWTPGRYDFYIHCINGYFIADLTRLFNLNIDPSIKFDYFSLNSKKLYKGVEMRDHLDTYINYFEKFYDVDHEYMSILLHLKTIIDTTPNHIYTRDHLYNDLCRYILRSNIERKVHDLVEDNYLLELNYVNTKAPSLQYTDEHAKALFRMSILMDLCIPILTHYAYIHKLDGIDDYLYNFYSYILYLYIDKVDMYAKLYDTAITNIDANQKTNQGVWDKQNIRGIDISTHTITSVRNIILNIIPRYTFKLNIISFNCAGIRENTKYQVTDIGFEYSYIPISSSKRDEDSVSDFDKFESPLIRQNEALYLQNDVNYKGCMNNILTKFGPFNPNEIQLFSTRLLQDEEGKPSMNIFQRNLIFNLFYKYFGDTQSISSITRIDYIKLIIATKHMLLSRNMILLPYILTGKVTKIVSKKSVNKEEIGLIKSSPLYEQILNAYKSDNIMKHILSIFGTIISSDFTYIDTDPEIDGKNIEVSIPILIQEILMYILMCK